MKKEITLGQLLTGLLSLLITVVTAWITLNNKVSSHSEKIKTLEERLLYGEKMIERVETKIDRLNEQNTRILIALENKKNRE